MKAQDIKTVCMMPDCRAHIDGPADSLHVSHGLCWSCELEALNQLWIEEHGISPETLASIRLLFELDALHPIDPRD